MRGELQNRRVLVRGKEVFIGVDVHKGSWQVTALFLLHSFRLNPATESRQIKEIVASSPDS